MEFMGLQIDIPIGDHKVGFIMELEQEAYFGGEIKPSSHKNERNNIKIQSPRENHIMVLLDLKKRKTKDAFKGENLPEEPKDGGFNLPISEY